MHTLDEKREELWYIYVYVHTIYLCTVHVMAAFWRGHGMRPTWESSIHDLLTAILSMFSGFLSGGYVSLYM